MSSIVKLILIVAGILVIVLVFAGIFKMFLRMLAVVISVALSIVLAPYVSEMLENYTKLDEYIYDVAYTNVEKTISEKTDEFFEAHSGEEEFTKEDYLKFLQESGKNNKKIGISRLIENAIIEQADSIIGEEEIAAVSDIIAYRVTDYMMGIISVMAVYLVCTAVLSGIRYLISLHRYDRDY